MAFPGGAGNDGVAQLQQPPIVPPVLPVPQQPPVKKLQLAAHANYYDYFGTPPYEPDPFEPGKNYTDQTFDLRYLEVARNGCLDNYVFTRKVTGANGSVVLETKAFFVVDYPNKPVQLQDRIDLTDALTHLKDGLHAHSMAFLEQHLVDIAVALGMHRLADGASFSSVLVSCRAISRENEPTRIALVVKLQESLSDRATITAAVDSFFAPLPFVPVITRDNISNGGTMSKVVLTHRPQLDWTGNFFKHYVKGIVGKQILRKIKNKCPQATLRPNKEPKTAKDSRATVLMLSKMDKLIEAASVTEKHPGTAIYAIATLLKDRRGVEGEAPADVPATDVAGAASGRQGVSTLPIYKMEDGGGGDTITQQSQFTLDELQAMHSAGIHVTSGPPNAEVVTEKPAVAIRQPPIEKPPAARPRSPFSIPPIEKPPAARPRSPFSIPPIEKPPAARPRSPFSIPPIEKPPARPRSPFSIPPPVPPQKEMVEPTMNDGKRKQDDTKRRRSTRARKGPN